MRLGQTVHKPIRFKAVTIVNRLEWKEKACKDAIK